MILDVQKNNIIEVGMSRQAPISVAIVSSQPSKMNPVQVFDFNNNDRGSQIDFYSIQFFLKITIVISSKTLP